jgi:hypothetical protein
MGAIVVLKFPSERIRKPAVGSPVSSGAPVAMARESTKRKLAEKPAAKKRNRYVPDWRPLKAKWDELEGPKQLSQKAMASHAVSSAGAISQFLSGETKLTVEWALQFALYMRVPITDIWPDFPFAPLVPGSLTPEEVEVALLYRMAKDPVQKQALTAFLRSLQRANHS